MKRLDQLRHHLQACLNNFSNRFVLALCQGDDNSCRDVDATFAIPLRLAFSPHYGAGTQDHAAALIRLGDAEERGCPGQSEQELAHSLIAKGHVVGRKDTTVHPGMRHPGISCLPFFGGDDTGHPRPALPGGHMSLRMRQTNAATDLDIEGVQVLTTELF